MNVEDNFVEKKAQVELEKRYGEAEKILQDHDKLERFLHRLEHKLKVIPLVGDRLAAVPTMISLLNSYAQKEYTDIPFGSLIAIIGALIYFLSPVDFIPESIPLLGYIDDAAVMGVCWKLVESDVEDYTKWREERKKV